MFKLYSERQENEKGEPEVYEYTKFPTAFRNQVFFIISDILDMYEKQGDHLWNSLHDRFAREKGLKLLGSVSDFRSTYGKSNLEYYIEKAETLDLLDLIDFVFNTFVTFCEKNPPSYSSVDMKLIVKQSIHELNYRFKQSNLGYEFIKYQVIRIDNKHTHENIIKPVLYLLYIEGFEGPEEEFRKAFEYRKIGDNKNAILEALKSFESTMKTICDKKNYHYNSSRDTAQKLIKILEENNFYPSYLNSHLTNIRTTLETGLPVLRNKEAGHGQGASVVNISDEFTEYALNLAATNILLLAKIYQSTK